MPAFCQTARESLSAYVDGELAPDRAGEIADHLTTCPACSAEYQALLETVAGLRSHLTRFTAPDVLRARIRAAVAATPSESVAAEQMRPSARNDREGQSLTPIPRPFGLKACCSLLPSRNWTRRTG